jgi:hypothetical protein
VILSCLTIIDLSTRWLAIIRIHEKTAEHTALLFDRSWLCRYPRPTSVIHDAGTKFGQELTKLLSSIGIQEVTSTVNNPCANAILERVHAVIGDML